MRASIYGEHAFTFIEACNFIPKIKTFNIFFIFLDLIEPCQNELVLFTPMQIIIIVNLACSKRKYKYM